MSTKIEFPRSIALGVPLILIAMLTVQCAGSDHERSDTLDNPGATGTQATGTNLGGEGSQGSAANDMGGAGNTAGNPTTGSVDPLYPGERVAAATPAEERSMARGDMRGLRSLLIADLEAVRARLNVGTMPEAQQKQDKELAAELAQGLERVDRALAAMDASTDVTWASMRDVQLKEVSEVRAWMIGYRNKPASRI